MRIVTFVVFLVSLVIGAFSQQSMSIVASRDNALYETSDGSLSSGIGPTLHIGLIGQTGGNRKNRAVIMFGLTGKVPLNATITSVRLTVNVSKVNNEGSFPASLHRLTADWGEGTSNGGTNGKGAASTTNDATWIHRFYNAALWTSPGGDFSDSLSASISIGAAGKYAFGSTQKMIDDVTGWLQDSSKNFGWIIIGNETNSQSVKVIDSRETPAVANRPTLEIQYTIPVGVHADPVSSPVEFSLGQNYPNPFNPSTTIQYEIPSSSFVTLTVYDLLGNVVGTLVESEQSGGRHEIRFDASTVAAGLYFYRLTAGSYGATKKMILLK